MGRPLRTALGGYVYHVLNRGNGRRTVFFKDGDHEAFERILGEALEHVPGMRLLAYTLMPNHWHLVLWPRRDGELSDFGHWLALAHTQRWHAHYHDIGTGHLYQGRFTSFPVAADEHFLQVCRYAERADRSRVGGGTEIAHPAPKQAVPGRRCRPRISIRTSLHICCRRNRR